jgi:AbiJ-like protein
MGEISQVTRRAIVDRWAVGGSNWSGRFSEEDFLSRLYDLAELPSNDSRFDNAAGDIWQHRVNNHDWEDDWVFYDERFKILSGSDESFLRFCCETVHPVVRPDGDEALDLVTEYNKELRVDGWELAPSAEISGRVVYGARKIEANEEDVELFVEPTGWPRVDRQIGELRLRLRDAVSEEQFQSVGHLCRETLITVAQAVYDRSRHPPLDGVEPSSTDVKRMLDAYIAVELAGNSNATARKHAKVAFDLANELQHERTAVFREAALCTEATMSVIRIVAILAGRRERSDLS